MKSSGNVLSSAGCTIGGDVETTSSLVEKPSQIE
jgi:hypothetical protein